MDRFDPAWYPAMSGMVVMLVEGVGEEGGDPFLKQRG